MQKGPRAAVRTTAFRRNFPNVLSLVRIPAAFAFLTIYSSSDRSQFAISISIVIMVVIADFFDGFLARRWQVVTQAGYIFDGIGDKAFYLAILLIIVRDVPTEIVFAALLILRDTFLYALRSIDRNLTANLGRLRIFTLVHATFIRLFFFGFFLQENPFSRADIILKAVLVLNFSKYIAIVAGFAPIVVLARAIYPRTSARSQQSE